MNAILADLNIPSPHHKTLKRREREAGPSFEKVADSSCDKAVKEESDAIEKLNSDRYKCYKSWT